MGSFILERDYGSGIGTWHGSRSRLGLLTELLSTNATPVTTGTCLNYRDEVSTTPLSRHVCTGVEMSNRCSIRALDRQASDADGSADGKLRTSGQRPVRTSASLVLAVASRNSKNGACLHLQRFICLRLNHLGSCWIRMPPHSSRPIILTEGDAAEALGVEAGIGVCMCVRAMQKCIA